MKKHSGVIKICLHTNSRQDNFPYKFEVITPEASISDTIISNFDWLKLCAEEKKDLTLSDRQEMFFLNNFSLNDIENHAYQLQLLLNSYDCQQITLNATSFGALICLSAMNLGDLRPDCQFTLHLHNFPPQFIPKHFRQIPPQVHCQLVFHCEAKNNLEKFSGLFEKGQFLVPSPSILKKNPSIKFKKIA